MQPAPVTLVVRGMDADSCKMRRQFRMEALRNKRAVKFETRRPRQMAGIPTRTADVPSSDSSVVSSNVSTYSLTKDELRRKKNRESAERSRLRKLALIDFLSGQAATLSAKLFRLNALNVRLRKGEPPAAAAASLGLHCVHSADGACSDCESADSDLSSVSGSSTPFLSTSSYSRGPTGKSSTTHSSATCASYSSTTTEDRSGVFADHAPPHKRSRASQVSLEAPRDHHADALDAFLCPASAFADTHPSAVTADPFCLDGFATGDDSFLLDGLLDFDFSEFPLTGLL
jgi:hypothetical protein